MWHRDVGDQDDPYCLLFHFYDAMFGILTTFVDNFMQV